MEKQKFDADQLKKDNTRQHTIGMVIGRQVYRSLKYCLPFADFEIDLHLLSAANVKIGNINHSRKFPSFVRPAFAQVVDNRVKTYLSEPLEATGLLPPIGIVADKLTTSRRTGKMYAGIVFTPRMKSLLTPISLDLASVTNHDGRSVAQDISDMCTRYKRLPAL